MKAMTGAVLVALMAAFGCSVGNAQLIYSNNFTVGAAVNISNTPPTVANSYAGGTNTALWNDALGINDPGDLQANGLDNTTVAGDSWLLPFKPQAGHVYLLAATVTFTNNPGNWIGVGFAQNNPTNIGVGNARFADSGVNGYDFAILTEGTGNVQYFAGPHATVPLANQNSFFPPGPGTSTVQMLLNTESNLWSIAGYVNGVQAGTNYTFTANPTIQAIGLTQTTLSAPNDVQWDNLTLATALQPFIVRQPAASQIVSGGSACTNVVTVVADTNSGTLFYQWYANGAPLVNGGSISGATTNVLIINPTFTANQFTNYYVVVTNNYGSATSSLASLTVLTNPVINSPIASTNLITFFGGTSIAGTNYVGSSPVFSVSAVGAQPLVYQWVTNGVAVGGATNASLTFTNLQVGGPTNFVCVVSNSFGEASNVWPATYVQTPLAPYPQAVLAAVPLDFWRLNEPDNGLNDGNDGVICNDYQSGNDGIYTNVVLGQTGYNSSETAETSAFFGQNGSFYCYAGQIQNVDFATTNGANAEFTVEAWAECASGNGAPVMAQGVYGASDSFNLGMDTNANPNFQFYVRSASGTVYKADSAIPAADFTWHHLVGVCDEANSNVTLYVDGQVAAAVSIPAKSGLFEAAAPISIGAGNDGSRGFNLQFFGFIDDVAAYNYALSIGQVIGQFAAPGIGNPVPVSLVSSLASANTAYLANQTLTLAATAAGSAPFGYYWTNLTAGGVLGSGETNVPGSLNATLAIPNASAALNGDQLELVVTNASSSTNWIVTLFNPAPPVTLSYTSPILYSNYFNGGTWSIAGMAATAANSLVGGTNTVWVDALGTNDTGGGMQAGGTPGTAQGDSWLLPFTPHSGYVYTLSASLTFSGNPGNWVGLGFAQNVPTNATGGRLSDSAVNSYSLIILTESSGNVQYFAGPSTGGTITNKTPFFTAGTGTHAVQMVLDTTGSKWKVYAFVDGIPAGTNTYSTVPLIGAVGFTQNALTTLGTFQWNDFALSQVAPGGVPPYPLAPPPPTNVTLLADTSLSIPVTTFGSAPFGYYWSNTNTAAVLGSGATNNMAPLSANLAVADVPASWNGNTLALIVTNVYGTNISLVSVTVTNAIIIPTNIPAITGFSFVGGTNLMIDATNGQSGGTYYLLGSTNLTTPLSQWLPLATNVIITNSASAGGFTFSGTNVIRPGNPQQFYILSNTN